MRERKNVKCPKRKKPVPFEAREGKCNHCNYLIVSSLSRVNQLSFKKTEL